MNASFEEKRVWVQLVGTIAGIGGYLYVALHMFAEGVDALPAYAAVFMVAVGLMVAILVLGHILAAVTGRVEQRDERDRLIEWRSESNSGWVLAVGIFSAITCMLFSISNVLVAHLLILTLFAATLMQYAFQILYYRRGM